MRWLVLVVVCLRVAHADEGGDAPPLGTVEPRAALPVASKPPVVEKRECAGTLYAEPTLLFGVKGDGRGASRLRGGIGFVAVGCTPENVETYNLRIGGFVEGGSEEIGDAFSAGVEVEYSDVFDGHRLGLRAHVDPSVIRTFSLGARLRAGPIVLGLEGIYSGRGKGQGAAGAVLGSIGVTGRAGAIVTLVGVLLAGVAVASIHPD